MSLSQVVVCDVDDTLWTMTFQVDYKPEGKVTARCAELCQAFHARLVSPPTLLHGRRIAILCECTEERFVPEWGYTALSAGRYRMLANRPETLAELMEPELSAAEASEAGYRSIHDLFRDLRADAARVNR